MRRKSAKRNKEENEKAKFYTPIILPDKSFEKIVVQDSLPRIREALYVARRSSPYTGLTISLG